VSEYSLQSPINYTENLNTSVSLINTLKIFFLSTLCDKMRSVLVDWNLDCGKFQGPLQFGAPETTCNTGLIYSSVFTGLKARDSERVINHPIDLVMQWLPWVSFSWYTTIKSITVTIKVRHSSIVTRSRTVTMYCSKMHCKLQCRVTYYSVIAQVSSHWDLSTKTSVTPLTDIKSVRSFATKFKYANNVSLL
jgi:hypothetical protein